MVIALEGSVCSGKTSMSQLICSQMGGLRIPDFMRLICPFHEVQYHLVPPHERIEIFFNVNHHRQSLTESVKDCLVVQDRTFLSVIAFEFALHNMGFKSCIDLLRKSNVKTSLPDYLFYFIWNDEIIKKRWIERESDEDSILITDDFLENTRNYFDFVSTRIEVFKFNLGNTSIPYVIEGIMDVTKSYSKNGNIKLAVSELIPNYL